MATQQVLWTPGTAVTFQDSGGTVAMALTNLAHQAGVFSALWDRGAGSKPWWYRVRALLPLESTGGVLGEWLEVYLATSSENTNYDGIAVAAAALVTAQRPNLKYVGAVILGATSVADAKLMRTFDVCIAERYLLVGVWNNTAAEHLQNDANASVITITPYTDDIQAAA